MTVLYLSALVWTFEAATAAAYRILRHAMRAKAARHPHRRDHRDVVTAHTTRGTTP